MTRFCWRAFGIVVASLVLIGCGGGGGNQTGPADASSPDVRPDTADGRDGGPTDGGDAGPECRFGRDCESGVCIEGSCAAPSCDDQVKNGGESDIDCGGPDCDPCQTGDECEEGSDCATGVCESVGGDVKTCSEPDCEDGVKNGNESDRDCGGPDCPACEQGDACQSDSDCAATCDGGTCAAPSCSDGATNGDETGIDCGGPDCRACPAGLGCGEDDDCQSGVCDGGTCASATCSDGVQNSTESDVDCGGVCDPCPEGKNCNAGQDCKSESCKNGTCAAPTCSDGIKNQGETEVDCGGSCTGCAPGDDCNGDGDCASGICTAGRCQAPTCDDGVANGKETDVDCGGPDCQTCAVGKSCSVDGDCETGRCVGGTCRKPPCKNGKKDKKETDVDCGGPRCSKCGGGKSCASDSDCKSGRCKNGRCVNCKKEGKTRTRQRACGFKDRGTATEICRNEVWRLTKCKGVWFASCAEIHTAKPKAGDGKYTIDPDGPKPVYDSFDVTCNMTTKGGGWTGISRCTAQKELRGRIKTVVSGSSVGIDKQCRPHARDRNGSHNYLYTFDFPGGFSEFYLKNFAVEADAHGFRDTSELNQGKEYGTWTQKNPVPNDIAFGSGAFAKPTTSYVRQLSKKKECKSCTIPWPADGKIFKMKSRANSFRIGFAEGGGQDEGWIVWTKGMIYVR